MTSFPEPEWSHPRWRPEARGPRFSTSTSMGVEKRAPSLGWRHYRRRHLGIKMAAPQVTSGGRRDSHEDILQTSVPSSERGGPSPKTSRRCLKLFFLLFVKHLIVSLPQPFSKWLRELPACHYGEVDQSARVNTTFHKTWCWLRQTPTLLFFFNCSLQYTQIIVEYSVIVGRSLVWLETNLNPTMTILLFSSILSAKRQWQSSTSMRPVWQLQKSVMSRIQSTDHEEAIFVRQRGNIKMVNWPDCGGVQIVTARKCNIKHHRQFYSRLVLPPYTVKIRGGRLGRIIEMSSCPTTQNS